MWHKIRQQLESNLKPNWIFSQLCRKELNKVKTEKADLLIKLVFNPRNARDCFTY